MNCGNEASIDWVIHLVISTTIYLRLDETFWLSISRNIEVNNSVEDLPTLKIA